MEDHKKKKRKSPVKFNLTLNEEQKAAKRTMLDNDITLIRGYAGTGKSLCAVQCALSGLFNKDYTKIILARPLVDADEEMGFLPGLESQKLEPYLRPLMDNIFNLYGDTNQKRDKIAKLIDDGSIEVTSIGKLRGRTFTEAFVICDESQNITELQAKLIATRLGKGSKLVFTGDLGQLDLKGKSGLAKLVSLVPKIEGMADVVLTENHRSGIVKELIENWN